MLPEEHEKAVLQQKNLWTNAMAEDMKRGAEKPPDVLNDLVEDWTDEQRCQFNEVCLHEG